MKFWGIADAHGLESLTCAQDSLMLLKIRAESNRHRHAVVFQAELTKSQADSLKNMIRLDPICAFKALNGLAAELAVEKGWERSWAKLPDPSLDPWWREPEKAEA